MSKDFKKETGSGTMTGEVVLQQGFTLRAIKCFCSSLLPKKGGS